MSRRNGAREPHADSATVTAVTRDDNWIMVLERKAPRADLSKETGFDVCAVTLGLTTTESSCLSTVVQPVMYIDRRERFRNTRAHR